MNNEDIKKKINECLLESEIDLGPSLIISSLTLVTLAVKLEKAFAIRFSLDEINENNFNSYEKIKAIIMNKNTK